MPLAIGLALVVIVLDQLSKWAVIDLLMRPDGITATPFYTANRVVLAPVLDVVMTWNRGVSFGIGNGADPLDPFILSGLAVAVVIGILAWVRRAETIALRLAGGLIIGGALGNVIDRLRYGAVADFIDVHVAGYHWPAFNLADSAITVGAVIMVADSLFGRRDSTKT